MQGLPPILPRSHCRFISAASSGLPASGSSTPGQSPNKCSQWRGPEGFQVLEAHSDPRPGGKHRVVVRGTPPPRSPEDKPVEVTGASSGVYLDVDPYSLVRFTWIADWAPGEESVVTVRLSDAEDGGTLMDFTHDKFLTPQSANGHNLGWSSAFNKLAKFLER